MLKSVAAAGGLGDLEAGVAVVVGGVIAVAIRGGEDAGEPEHGVVGGDDVVDGRVVATENEHPSTNGLAGLIDAAEPADRQAAEADAFNGPDHVEVVVELADDAHAEM